MIFRKRKTKYQFPLYHDLRSIEQANIIRTNIQLLMKKECKSLMITSADKNEQKPVITAILAISFAEQGKKVLLIDGNVRNPSLHCLFNIENSSGLTDLLLHMEEPQLVMKDTYIHNLYVLPTGAVPDNPSRLFISRRLEELLEQWKEEFDLIIFETPAFLEVTDSQILSNKCDGVLLVIQENKTKMEEALKTKKMLERGHNNILGVILHPFH